MKPDHSRDCLPPGICGLQGIRRVLVAPDSFKGTLSAAEAAGAIADGLQEGDATVIIRTCPLADGGEGTLSILCRATDGEEQRMTVVGPLGRSVEATWAWLGTTGDRRTALVELAQAAGLGLIDPDERDPMITTTYGVGQLVREAVRAGADEILLALGGSATVDGGMGAAQALGVEFFDEANRLITRPLCGGTLSTIARVGVIPSLPPIRLLADVRNPLLGPDGAAAIYGPQKGASPEQIELLESNLAHVAACLGGDPTIPGSGAAGGVAYGLHALFGASIERGFDVIIDSLGLEAEIATADLVITGEGRLDAQTRSGKVIDGLCRLASGNGVPVVAIAGEIDGDVEAITRALGLTAAISLGEMFGQAQALSAPASCLRSVASAFMAAMSSSGKRGPTPMKDTLFDE